MGFFSWKTSDTNKTVWNRHTRKGPTPCKMLLPGGREYIERAYDGYGDFGGVDFYAALDEINGGTGDRDQGIKRAFSGDDGVLFPKIASIDYAGTWDDLPDSPMCETQGYFGGGLASE